MSRFPSAEALAKGVETGDRALLGRAVTLVESRRAADRPRAEELLERLAAKPRAAAHRIGVTGIPGAGKSTFLEALGLDLLAAGRRPAVLAVDPSSTVSGGSILGDKTRMPRLAADTRAFVRPSPSGGSLGGVARATRETIAVCEAAGFDPVLIETVGVGQSEARVAEMVDSVLLLLLPGAGDELQGIKRGLLEWVDVVAVNKADGDRVEAAQRTRLEHESALRLFRPAHAEWTPPVEVVSAAEGTGLGTVWQKLEEHRAALETSGRFESQRIEQRRRWLWRTIEDRLLDALHAHPQVAPEIESIEARVAAGTISPTRAAERLLDLFQASSATETNETASAARDVEPPTDGARP